MSAVPGSDTVLIRINGQDYTVPAGISAVAAIRLATGWQALCRSRPQDGEKSEARGPYCMMGVCFDCVAEINGRADQQTCLTVVEAGMDIRLDQGKHLCSPPDTPGGCNE